MEVEGRPTVGSKGVENGSRHQSDELRPRHFGSGGNGIDESGGAEPLGVDEIARHLSTSTDVEAEGAHQR